MRFISRRFHLSLRPHLILRCKGIAVAASTNISRYGFAAIVYVRKISSQGARGAPICNEPFFPCLLRRCDIRTGMTLSIVCRKCKSNCGNLKRMILPSLRLVHCKRLLGVRYSCRRTAKLALCGEVKSRKTTGLELRSPARLGEQFVGSPNLEDDQPRCRFLKAVSPLTNFTNTSIRNWLAVPA